MSECRGTVPVMTRVHDCSTEGEVALHDRENDHACSFIFHVQGTVAKSRAGSLIEDHSDAGRIEVPRSFSDSSTRTRPRIE
jgi:hypothetical protein